MTFLVNTHQHYVLTGVEAATGSLGHGLPIAVGFALAAKKMKFKNRIDVLLGDGECNEGTIWGPAMLASAKSLERLTVVIDFNKWQATDRSKGFWNSILCLINGDPSAGKVLK